MTPTSEPAHDCGDVARQAQGLAAHPEGIPGNGDWVVYLLECAGERLYAGITNDLACRMTAHGSGTGARFTRSFSPKKIVACRRYADRSAASKAEYALKQLPRSKKAQALLAGTLSPKSKLSRKA